MFRKFKNCKNIFNLLIKYMDDKTAKLFPEINPNVEELVERDNAIDSENVIVENIDNKTEVKNMFVNKKNNKRSSPIIKKNIKLEIKNEDDTKELIKVASGEKKDKYAHLNAARQKGIETRKRKAEERKALKEAEKLEKQKIKDERKKATMERNRQKARERYYKEKEKKKTVPQKIINDTEIRGMNKVLQKTNNNMDFNTFAKYMMKYENMKEAYNKQKTKPVPKKVVEKVEKKKSYHSANYPLAHLYNPQFRNTEQYF